MGYMGYQNIDAKLQHTIDAMSLYEQDQVYRYLWAQHVRADIEALCAENDIVLTDNEIDCMVERYVDGCYDCNLDYWTNLRNLLPENK